MIKETVETPHRVENGAPTAPSAHPASATEQLAQLTLDSLPGWMKAPGGIQRFRLLMAAVVATGALLFAAIWLHLASYF